jgi:uncharacterized protein HemX
MPTPPAPPRARPNVWTWVLLATSVVLFLAAIGLGVGYYAAYSAGLDRNDQIGRLYEDIAARDATIAEQAEQLEQAEQERADVEAELAELQDCVDAMDTVLSVPQGTSDAEFNALFEEMLDICGF